MNTRRNYFGLIGNGETAALVAPDLTIGWLCAPRFDGAPLFASALDPRRGGRLTLQLVEGERPVALVSTSQAYLGRTAVLQTRLTGEGWRLESSDYMPWGQRIFVREMTVTNEALADRPLRVRALVNPVGSSHFPVAVSRQGGALVVSGERAALLVTFEPGGTGDELDLGLVPAGGSVRFRLHLAYGENPEGALHSLAGAPAATLEAVSAWWENWIGQAVAPSPDRPADWNDSYWRSLVVMKLLSYAPTGALLAAPTASLPAVPGGSDNWDYRYVWLRDGYYTAMTFNAAGLHQEAERFYDFAFGLQGPDGHWEQPLFTLDGGHPQEFIVDDLQGPGGEVPVRFGNAASGQLQLDNEGNILHGLWFHYQSTGDRPSLRRHWDGVRRACEWVIANWNRPENGIWEIREYTAHWVHGKAMCCAALESGAQIARTLGRDEEARRWEAQAGRVKQHLLARAWNPERGAYLSHFGAENQSPHLDISVLALVFYGLVSADDPRVQSTVRQMEREQSEGGLALHGGICRYDYGAVPFYLPTLWLARYYLMAGRAADCDRLVQTCIDCATSLGLMAEHFDGRDQQQWGNFPQAFSHEEVARLVLERGQGWAFCQPEPFGAPARRG